LVNPHHISSIYMTQSVEEISEKKKNFLKELELKNLEKSLDEKAMWINYHKRSNLVRKEGFIDKKPPEYLKKGEYREPWEIQVNMYRDESQFGELFKLFHKPLRANEKSKNLGKD